MLEPVIKVHNAYAVSKADYLLECKQTMKVWDVIEKVLEIWADSRPGEYRSYVIELDRIKNSRKVTKGFKGVSHDKGTGGDLRYLVDIPEWVYTAIRFLYSPEELQMDKKFFHTFTRKFPKFKVMEKV